MKLILTINGILIKEQKLYPPVYDKYLSFDHNFDVRQEYVNKMIRTFKEKNRDKLIGEWKIMLTVNSKMNVIRMDEAFIKYSIFKEKIV